jgi:drug/metabolite transporter (DMT)-like permease
LTIMENVAQNPLPAKCWLSAMGSLLANFGVTVMIGGFGLVPEVIQTPIFIQFLLNALVALILGFFLRRYRAHWIFIAGILTGLLGSLIIVIQIMSNI